MEVTDSYNLLTLAILSCSLDYCITSVILSGKIICFKMGRRMRTIVLTVTGAAGCLGPRERYKPSLLQRIISIWQRQTEKQFAWSCSQIDVMRCRRDGFYCSLCSGSKGNPLCWLKSGKGTHSLSQKLACQKKPRGALRFGSVSVEQGNLVHAILLVLPFCN